MKKNDYIGLGVSVAVHALLLLLFSTLTIAAADQPAAGFVEVDFGPIAEGRPVQQAENPAEEEVESEEAETTEETTDDQTNAPEEARPVDLPDQAQEIVDEESVASTDAEAISPEVQDQSTDAVDDEPSTADQVAPQSSGDAEGDDGESSGEDGEGSTAEKTAPFSIEGLNRIPVTAPLPPYAEKVNAVIRVRVTVNPQGQVISRIPLIKGNPALEAAVMETLREWRFNALPSNAPQENQTGIISFKFRLE